MQELRRTFPFFSRRRWGVKNLSPWGTILRHTFHQFHENDLFTPAAAMSYFGLLTLFPALLVLLVLSNQFAAGSEALSRAVEVYRERFGLPDGRVPATFEIVTLTGWAPHPDQPKPLRPGSATARLADALGTRERKASQPNAT